MQIINRIWPEWKVEKEIGQGSYGTVYKCVNETKEYCAMKVISIPQNEHEMSEVISEKMSVEQSREYYKDIADDLIKEIEILKALKGTKNIVEIYDAQIIEKEDGIGWNILIRMELLTDFNTYISDKQLSEKDVIKLGADLGNALSVCHKAKIIHRDIKPENILVDDEGNFKLGDFGVAKQMEKTQGSMSVKGTYNYMSPEVFAGKKCDGRADLYSLALVMYKLLNNNRLPFIDPNKQIVRYSERQTAFEKRINGEELPPIQGVSNELNAVILKACAFKPNDRQKDIDEFNKELGFLVEGKKIINKKLLKKIAIATAVVVLFVSAAVSIYHFSKPNVKDVELENIFQNDENVIQNNENAPIENIDYHNPIDYFEPGAGVITYDKTIMNNTIDLRQVNLFSEFNIGENHEISVPYPTSLGTVYLVREHLTEKSLTYLFVATQDDIVYEMVTDIGFESIADNNGCVYELYTANVDNEPGEEIILMTNTGGNGGRGSWEIGVYKITDKGTEKMSFAEDGYIVIAEKPFKYVITNAYTDLYETVEANKDYAYDFEEDGSPVEGTNVSFYSMPWYIRPEDVDNDGICEIVTKEWISVSKDTEENVDFITTYKYDAEQEKFVVCDASVMYSSDEDDVYGDDYRRYAYCDINDDGVDEFIINYSVKTNSDAYLYLNRYEVYTYNENNRLVYAGETGNNYSYFYCPANTGVLVETSIVTSMIYYNVYSLENNKLIKTDSGKGISIEYEDAMYKRLNGYELEWKYY